MRECVSVCLALQSAAQQSQEDAVIAAQVRREMWGNMQSIVAMLAGQGCSPHVQDMVHQIAVHFANEQSQSVALERRMMSNLSREKDIQKQLQQQLRGSIQVNGFLFVAVAIPAFLRLLHLQAHKPACMHSQHVTKLLACTSLHAPRFNCRNPTPFEVAEVQLETPKSRCESLRVIESFACRLLLLA